MARRSWGCGGRFLPMQGVKYPIILPVEGVKSLKAIMRGAL